MPPISLPAPPTSLTTITLITGGTLDVYEKNNPVIISLTCYAVGVLTTPATVTMTIRLPDNTTSAVNVAATTVGSYSYVYTPALVGIYEYTWSTTGPIARASGQFQVINTDLGI